MKKICFIILILLLTEYSFTINKDTKINKIITLAKQLVNTKYKRFKYDNESYNGDCSGFIKFLFATQNVQLINPDVVLRKSGGTYSIFYSMIYQTSIHKGSMPAVGDIIFFNDTYDKNGDKKMNDPLTHIGIVEKVKPDGTITFIHYLNPKSGVIRDKVNLVEPNNRLKNSYIRDKRRYPNPKGRYLTGQLFNSFATVRF